MTVQAERIALEGLVGALRAAGEDTRLRLLTLLAEGELTVSDLTEILGQSQPRISRHLKLLTEAGLIERHREGAWAFFRIADRSPVGGLARALAARLDLADTTVAADRARLATVRAARAAAAQAYFDRYAHEWDRIRSLHVSDVEVEAAIEVALGGGHLGALLDLGTGTGRILGLLGARASRAVGVDTNHAMLAVARANLERVGLRGAELRQGDIYALPVERGAFDTVIIHQVLHFLDDPARAVREAVAALAPGGTLLVVDFAPHELEFLRESHAHRRLGFSRDQIADWMSGAGLVSAGWRELPAPGGDRDRLTVSLWLGHDPRAPRQRAARSLIEEMA